MALLGGTVLGCSTESELKRKIKSQNNRVIFFRILFCFLLPGIYSVLGFYMNKLPELGFYTIILSIFLVCLFSYVTGLQFPDVFPKIFKKEDAFVWFLIHSLHLFLGLLIGYPSDIAALGILAFLMVWVVFIPAIPCDRYLKKKKLLI